MSSSSDDAQRVQEISARHAPFDFGMRHPISGEWASRVSCKGCYEPWPCEQSVLLARLDALTAERDAAAAPCALALEYRDGVTCRDERDRGVCLNHRVIEGLRVHAVTADRLELENRVLRRQVRATYGIIHEGLHGGKPTDPEHQEACEKPSCRNARAALAAASEGE